MARNSRSMYFLFFGQDKTLSKSMDHAGNRAVVAAGRFRATGQGITKSMGLATLSVAALSYAVGRFAGDSVKGAADAEKQQNRLALAFARFPKLADTNQKALQKLNSALEFKVGVDDDEIAAGQAVIAQYGLTGKQVKAITPLMIDYAKRTGQDVPGAAKSLGRAVLGSGKALKSIGVNFKDTKTKAGNFNEIMSGLRNNVGGFAENEGLTAAGRLEILRVKFGEVQEKIGTALLPVLEQLVGYATTTLVPALDTFADWFVNTGLPNITAFTDWLQGLPGWVPAVVAGVGILAAAFWALDAAMDLNPIGAIVVGVELLVAGIALLIINLQDVGNFVIDATLNISNFFFSITSGIAGFIDMSVNAMLGGISALLGPLNTLLSMVGQAAIQIPNVKLNLQGAVAGGKSFFGSGAAIAKQQWNSSFPKAAKPKAPKPPKSYGGGGSYKPPSAPRTGGGGGGGGSAEAAKKAAARRKAAAKRRKKAAALRKKKAAARALLRASQVGATPGTRHSIDGGATYGVFIPGTTVQVILQGSVIANENELARTMHRIFNNGAARGVIPVNPGRKR